MPALVTFLRSRAFWMALGVFLLVNLAMIPHWREIHAALDEWERYPAYAHSDEVYVYRPAESVFRGGYLGYRCITHEANGGCYGGTQALLDGAYLSFFSRSELEARPGVQAPGQWWPWVVKYPNVLSSLRWQRFAVSFLFPWMFLLIALAMRSPLPIYAGAAIAASESYFYAWQGLKNDVAVLPWLFAFSWLLSRAIEKSDRGERMRGLLAAMTVGVLGNSVRPVLLPVLPFAFALTFLLELRRSPWRRAILDVALVLAFSVSVHTAANPSILRYNSEWAHNLMNFYGIQNGIPFSAGRAAEEFLLCLPYFSPGLLALAYLLRLRREGRSWEELLAPHVVFPLLSGLGLDLLAFKSLRHLHQYYLPGMIFFAALWIDLLRRHPLAGKGARRGFEGALLALIPLQLLLPHPANILGKFPWAASLPASGQVFLDVNLRAPLQEPIAPLDLRFFDSLTTSPSALAQRNPAGDALVFVPCWDPADKFPSPAAHAWAALLEGSCRARHVSFASGERALRTYVYGAPIGDLITVKWAEIAKAARESREPPLEAKEISPRILENGNETYSSYDFPVYLFRDTALRGRFRLGRAISSVEVPLWSRCRGGGAAELVVKVNGVEAARLARSLDTTAVFDQSMPFFLRGSPYFRRYLRRAFPLEPLRTKVVAASGDELQISLAFSGLEPDTCGVSMTTITLD